MALPIIGTILEAVDGIADKIWPDANDREKNAQTLKLGLMEYAFKEKQLLFQDTDSARDLFKAELDAQNTPKFVLALQKLARPFTMYSMVTMYVYVKIAPIISTWINKDIPDLNLNDGDYYLIGTVFVFLFGARTIEKLKKSA